MRLIWERRRTQLLCLFLGSPESQQTLVPLRFELLRPLGSPADREGREDDDERDQDGVEELGGQGSTCLAKSWVKSCCIAAFQARAATRPRAVVINSENLSSTSAVTVASLLVRLPWHNRLPPAVTLYSPMLVEEAFSEVRMHDPA